MSSPYPPPPEPQGQQSPMPGHPEPQGQQSPMPGHPGAMPPGYPGAMPGMPPASSAPRPVGPRPGSVTAAVRLMWAGAALSLVSALLTPTMGDTIRTQLRDAMATSGTALTPSELDTFVTAVLGVAVVFGLIGVGLWLLMAWQNGKGKNWARIVATVLLALNAVSLLTSLPQLGSAPLPVALSALTTLVGAAAVYLLWRKESTAWFQALSRPR